MERKKLFAFSRKKKRFFLGSLSSSQSTITCTKLAIETLEQGAKYAQS